MMENNSSSNSLQNFENDSLKDQHISIVNSSDYHHCNNNRESTDWTFMRASVLPNHLPDFSCSEFVEYLQKLINDTKKLMKNQSPEVEAIKVITWLTAISYTNTSCEVPACTTITDKCFYIFELVHPESPHKNVPLLKLFYATPLQNIERFVIGLNGLNVRLEESFQGPLGTFILITSNKKNMENLLSTFAELYNKRVLNLGLSVASGLIQMDQNSLNCLKKTLNFVEKKSEPMDLNLVLHIHVYCQSNENSFSGAVTRNLILTKDFVHIIKENWFVGLKTTLEHVNESKIQYEIIDSFSISSTINDINLFEIEIPWTINDYIPFSKSKNSIFGIKLTFQNNSLESGLSFKVLNICMQSRELRDVFLENLTCVRQEFSTNQKTPIEFISAPLQTVEDCCKQRNENKIQISKSASNTENSSEINKNISVRTADPPKSLSLMINHSKSNKKILSKLSPTIDFTCRKIWIKNIPPLSEISTPMQHLATMCPEKLTEFLKEIGIQMDSFNEDLLLGMFTSVTPYSFPKQEIMSCVILSTKSIYFLSDSTVCAKDNFVKTHHRYQSDSAVDKTVHLDPWIMGDHSLPRTLTLVKSVKCYNIIPLKSLVEVVVGLFDQKFRLTGSMVSQILTCITRDTEQTELFLQTLKSALTNHITTPSPQPKDGSQEPDFYSQYTSQISRTDSGIYLHPSKVKFIYQGEETIKEFTYLIHENMHGIKPKLENISLLVYILGLQKEKENVSPNSSIFNPRTILLTSTHIGLSIDDHVQYPIPDFVITLPDDPPMQIVELRQIEYLKRIISIPDSHDIILVFEDESEDFIVDVNKEYYSSGDEIMAVEPPKEVQWELKIKSLRDKDRLLRWLCKLYAESQGGQLLLTTCYS